METNEDAASILAAHQQQAVAAIGGQDELILIVPERDSAGTSHKRAAPDDHLEEEQEDGGGKRRKKDNPPPKKLNNEQWDLMFDRLVEYKREHGVSSPRTRLFRTVSVLLARMQWILSIDMLHSLSSHERLLTFMCIAGLPCPEAPQR